MAKKLTKEEYEKLKKSFIDKKVAFTELTIHRLKTKKKIYSYVEEGK
mgnify:CR=1 FL=1